MEHAYPKSRLAAWERTLCLGFALLNFNRLMKNPDNVTLREAKHPALS
jgi:hypothetical protein